MINPSPLPPLWAAPEISCARAEPLAREIGTVLVDTLPARGQVLVLESNRLLFRLIGDHELKGSLWVDFNTARATRRSRQVGSELLVKAARIRRVEQPLLIDATAGLGQDGFLLATHGFQVEMIEMNPVVAALLADGLARAAEVEQLAEVVGRIQLHRGNSVERLASLTRKPHVIYLDPMFPERSKSAKVKQNLRLLQHLDAHTVSPEELLTTALATQAKKVVVKRPLKGPYLCDEKPSYSLKGKAVRFDVYLV
ncbi:class I SAM-dependent methyltransferase [Desulfobulbus rhabdoformis]|uniref:class I SAM-dependent methyltransferase n=1 Tax=Desulfobulbus rhabdoformis TaxID=34032 RepID=UPI0019654658|nr:class I SAM-dependent methyltransferase [Desulfobulbus rhabdoformis]MBM9614170.1 class I SAM-dependent methyltransferase [Desulfobulbus rhabdoformis]